MIKNLISSAKKRFLVPISLSLAFVSFGQKTQLPLAPSIPATDTYHGVTITDEYRNLENLNDSTVLNWMKLQSDFSQKTIKKISNREDLLKRYYEFDSRNTSIYYDFRIRRGSKYFYLKEKTADNYEKLYYRDGYIGEEKVIYDPKQFKPETNKTYTIGYYKPNNAGTQVAIALTEGGREISEIITYDLKSQSVLPGIITNTWPSDLGGIDWLKDDSGFIYTYIPNIDITSDDFIKNTQSVLYKIGDDPKKFKVLFSKSNNPNIAIKREDFPMVYPSTKFSDYCFGYLGGATNYNDIYFGKVNDFYNETINWKPFIKKEDQIKDFILEDNNVLYISEKGGKSRLCKTSLEAPDFSGSTVLVDQIKDEIINSVIRTKDGIFFTSLKNGVSAKLYFYKDNQYKSIKLPFEAGNISIQNVEDDLSDFWVTISGWTQPRERYKFDVIKNSFSLENFNEKYQYPEFKYFVVKEIEIKTPDGLDLPLTIIHKKGLKLDGKNKTIIRGYGSYASSYNPSFSYTSLMWVLDGGILVTAHVRGGGEKGEEWHQGGFKTTKPNTWKDLITSAEYLIKQKYTSPKYIGIKGASAGGILIGRALTERPDLFKAAIIDVGMLNAIRSETTPNGPNNVKEFGTVENEIEFKALLEMDAFHHIKKGIKYPATLINTGMNDPRVITWEPTKFAAKLQANNTGSNPVFLNVDMDGGHGADISTAKFFEKTADDYAFLYWQLGDSKYQLKKE